jgi:HSP20 family molecular chaperone IbpA
LKLLHPGFSREDFVIVSNGHLLSLVALKSPAVRDEYPLDYIPGTQHKFIKEDIQLPKGVDTDFGMAEFKNGLLSIQFYKTDYPVESRRHPIIVLLINCQDQGKILSNFTIKVFHPTLLKK